jgi:DTW domain-containing protein YfiP
MHSALCLCAEVPMIDVSTRVVLVMHRREVKKTSNTGRLALLAMADCELHVRGHPDRPADLSTIERPDRRMLLLFPRDDAVVLTRDLVAADPRPITLVVPDGTWGQARRAVRRESVLASTPAIGLPQGPPSRYRLRRPIWEGCLATAEAIARALGVIEGPHVQRQLERLLDIMVERTLSTRSRKVRT